MTYFSNEEIKNAPKGYKSAQVLEGGIVKGPQCCGKDMMGDGGCSKGCCDDYKCSICGYQVRIEWPD